MFFYPTKMTNKEIKCLICESAEMYNYYYPNVHYNDKVFTYLECNTCKSAQINPMPEESDYKKMYGTNDHKYLSNLEGNEKINFSKKMPTYNHQKQQIDFFNYYNYKKSKKTLLDFGCGSGFYINHAQNKGLKCTGIEFNKEFATLMKNKTGFNICTIDQIENEKFDIIHLGHVLEHMENPYETILELKKYAHSETIFIIDGPLEKNKCLSRFFIKIVSLIKNKKFNTYAPQHLTFTNYQSQLLFFERCKFEKINYSVKEQMFPFPEQFNIKSPMKSILFILSRISILISMTNSKWGNIFHYAGRLK